MAKHRHAINPDDPVVKAGNIDGAARTCDAPDCSLPGEFRAPKGRDRLDDYFWFCLDHVRAYNAGWNYYAGMSDAEVEAERRGDTYWHRPTWPLNGRLRHRTVDDTFGFFDTTASDGHANRGPRFDTGSPEADAFAIMELEPPVSPDAIKRRYKELVKRHHPDANGGDKAAEERLKAINQAYSTLMQALGA